MSLVLKYYKSRGDAGEERVVMQASADVELGSYILCQARRSDGAIYADLNRAFWFPDREIKGGDFVVVYSRSGRQKTKRNEATDRTTHFFYIGAEGSLWGGDDWAAVLMLVESWEALMPGGDADR